MRRAALAALADQALVSLAGLGAVLALVAVAAKEEVGVLLWLLAPTYMLLGLQNAVVVSPYITRLMGQPAERRADLSRTLAALAWWFLLAAVLLSSAVSVGMLVADHKVMTPPLAAAFALAVAGMVGRELQRSFAYAHQDAVAAFRGTVIYVVVLVGATTIFHRSAGLSAAVVLAAMGIAGCTSLVCGAHRPDLVLAPRRDELAEFFRLGRWAVPGVLAAWAMSNAYPLYLERNFGLPDVAEVGVARLWLMPIGLTVLAWTNYFRPRIFGDLHRGNYAHVWSVLVWSVTSFLGFCALVVGLAYVVGLAVNDPLRKEVTASIGLIGVWAAYFAAFAVRSVLQSPFLSDERGYRRLSGLSTSTVAVALLALLVMPVSAAWGVVALMTAAEAFMAVVLVWWLRRRIPISRR